MLTMTGQKGKKAVFKGNFPILTAPAHRFLFLRKAPRSCGVLFKTN